MVFFFLFLFVPLFAAFLLTVYIALCKPGCVTVRGHGLAFSIVHLPPLTVDSPFMFTVLVIFFTNTFRYVVW